MPPDMPPPPPALYREAADTVNLSSDSLELRFFPEFGAVPLQIYQPGAPPLMNEFAGSGASVTWRMAQTNDPTQASPDGIKRNPIHTKSQPSTSVHNYWGRETIFDPASGIYEVKLYCPMFWISQEPHDDSIPDAPGFSDSGWWTPYNPGRFGSLVDLAARPIFFSGQPGNTDGYFFVASERDEKSHWSQKLAEIPDGRVGFKIGLSLHNAGSGAFAGFVFRTTVPPDAKSKHDVYNAPGIRLNFNKSGAVEAIRVLNGERRVIWAGQLSPINTNRLLGIQGIEVEVRTHNNLPGVFWLLINSEQIGVISDDAFLSGPHFGLYANSSGGYITFQSRSVYDMGLEVTARWSTSPIVSDITIQLAPGVTKPRAFERVAMPAMFLNQKTFPENSRMVALVYPDHIREVANGSHLMKDVLGAWAGNRSGTLGLFAIPEIVEIDDAPAAGFHIYLDTKTTVSNEFVMHLDAMTEGQDIEASKIRMRTRWASRID